jgi:hypothetical protein
MKFSMTGQEKGDLLIHRVSMLPLPTILRFNFGTGPTVWYFLFLFYDLG